MTTRSRLHPLTPGELARAAAAWPVVAVVRLAIWLSPNRVPDVRPSASRPQAAPPFDVATRARALRVAQAVRRAARLVPGATCLTQAIAARRLLARQQIEADLRLGVARGEDRQIVAHAWLELGGEVILGDSPTRFAVLEPARSERSPHR